MDVTYNIQDIIKNNHSPWEYLLDEIKLLDLILYREVLSWQENNSDESIKQFKGLVISWEEINRLFIEKQPDTPDNLGHQPLSSDIKRLESFIHDRSKVSIEQNLLLPLLHISEAFHLNRFEEQCVILCLALELDTKYEKIYAFLQDDFTLKKPTIGFALKLFCHNPEEELAARFCLGTNSNLTNYIIHISDNIQNTPTPLISRSMKLDDHIVFFLLGFTGTDPRLDPFLAHYDSGEMPEKVLPVQERQAFIERVVNRHLNNTEQKARSLIYYFHGPKGSGRKMQTAAICHILNRKLIMVDMEKMPVDEASYKEILLLIEREVLLKKAFLCLDNFDSISSIGRLGDDGNNGYCFKLKLLFEMIKNLSGIVFIIGEQPWAGQKLLEDSITFMDMEFKLPDNAGRKDFWDIFGKGYRFDTGVNIPAISGKFQFTPGQIKSALSLAMTHAYRRAPEENGMINAQDIYTACHFFSNRKLNALAQKVEPKYSWGDLVLPPVQIELLKDICNQVIHKHLVYGTWGFGHKLSYGKGLNTLFFGPPGTGKTMAAEVIANELGLELYRIDLARVVSKYIGETEKNLSQIFEEAKTSNAVLLFDEADALFGKRSEIKDSHDRYANMEISFLLQKMEEYDGITFLATNLRNNLDDAFIRRISFLVEFPFPDAEYRLKIWQVMFPPEVPLSKEVDFKVIAHKVKLAGGSIKNITLAASFLAAADNQPVGMPHIIKAINREYQKLGRRWDETLDDEKAAEI